MVLLWRSLGKILMNFKYFFNPFYLQNYNENEDFYYFYIKRMSMKKLIICFLFKIFLKFFFDIDQDNLCS